MWCKSCRVTGYTHCAHPDECGNMVTLTAAADSWKSWLDDAPLPETFNSATGGLQDFITALSRALLDARAELAATQTQVGDWIVRADEANVKVETLEAELARVRADAQAAVARAYEAAAERLDLAEHDAEERDWRSGANAFAALAKGLRAIAPADGLAAVDALRAEARENAMQALASMGQAQDAYEAQLEAEAELAAAQQREAALTKALEACVASLERVDTAEGVCCCGDSMDRHSDPMSCGHSPVDMGDYYAGQALESARAALAQTPTDPGDGWTWNERLGWIGPDGKPADPRRRG